MHTAEPVANRLLALAEDAGRPLTPMQLIKLVYLCQGWMLGMNGRPLFSEPVEAWAYGPVIRSVYDAVRQYRDQPISQNLPAEPAEFDEVESDIIEQTFEQYGHLAGIALSTLTHQPGSPWSITHERLGRNATISNDLIQDHFANLFLKRISR